MLKCKKCSGAGKLIDHYDACEKARGSGLKQHTIAGRMNISETYLCDLLSGRRAFNHRRQQQFLEALK